MSSGHVAMGSRLRTLLIVLTAAVAGLIAVTTFTSRADAAPAYPPRAGCTMSGSPTSAAGGPVTITGSGFGSTESVSINDGGSTLGTPTTNSSGAFTTTVTVPAGSKWISANSATCPGSAGFAVDAVSVSANQPTTGGPTDPGTTTSNSGTVATSSSSSGGLAFTGFQAATVSLIGVVLLGGGALLIVFGRRRRAGR